LTPPVFPALRSDGASFDNGWKWDYRSLP
jgi:hypothetical protein